MNGPDGLRLTTFPEISVTLNFFLFKIDIALLISSLFLKENFSIFLLSSKLILAVTYLLLPSLNFIFNDQNSSGLKDSISCSLSVINFSATD